MQHTNPRPRLLVPIDDSCAALGNIGRTTLYELVKQALAAVPNLEGAACVGRDWHELEPDADPEVIERAVLTCQGCAALDPCRAWVESTPPKKRPSGIVAGRFYIDGTGRPVAPTDAHCAAHSSAVAGETASGAA